MTFTSADAPDAVTPGAPAARIRVLVVDDSVVVRHLVTEALSHDPSVEVVGSAANGRLALAKIEQLAPDVVTMDVEMPVMDGIDTVRALRASGSRVPVIMFSTLTERGASSTLDALLAGASDYVTKPTSTGSLEESLAQVANDLLPRIKVLGSGGAGGRRAARAQAADAPTATVLVAGPSTVGPASTVGSASTAGAASTGLRTAPVTTSPRPSRPAPAHPPAHPPAQHAAHPVTPRAAPAPRPVRAVVLGSSTGGPEALARVVSGLAVPLPVPLLVVQHMPPVFTRQLAARLDRSGPSTVLEAAGDETLEPGHVYVAPGNRHLEVRRVGAEVRTVLTDAVSVNFCRPSVDVLFRSAVATFGGDVLAVVLTGMGSDGRDGCEAIVTAGGTVLVQDAASSVVWGMPGSVAQAGLAHRVLPLDEISRVVQMLARGSRPVGAGLGRDDRGPA